MPTPLRPDRPGLAGGRGLGYPGAEPARVWRAWLLAAAITPVAAACAWPRAGLSVAAPGVDTARVFACAEDSARAQAAIDDRWRPAVTRRDLAAGTLETGDYPDHNRVGFRVQVRHRAARGRVDIRMKGAGAYATDLGVEAALQRFGDDLSRCLAVLPQAAGHHHR